MKMNKLFLRWITVFGLAMMFAVSGWGASNSPTVNLSCSPLTLNEGNSGITNVPCTISINVAPDSKALDVLIQTSNGTAISGSDYSSFNQTFSFAKNTATLSYDFNISVNGDTTYETNENFSVSATVSAANPQVWTAGTLLRTITITNDDSIPTLSVANVSQAEGSTGGYTQMVFTATLNHPTYLTSSVNYATSSGTGSNGASSGSDFSATTGTLTFNAGETTKTFSVNIIADTIVELDEYFTVNFSAESNMTSSTPPATGTILNDDYDAPMISIEDQSMVEGNSSTSLMPFIITVSNMKNYDVVVSYSTSDGTATSGSDYTATTGTVTFPSSGGTTQTQTIYIPIIGDTMAELNEAFYVLLSTSTANVSITDGNATGNIIDDDSGGSCSPYVGQMMINEYNFTPSVKDEFGNTIAGIGNFVELKVIGNTLRSAIVNGSISLNGWTLSIYNKANTPNVSSGNVTLNLSDSNCLFSQNGYLIYTFPSNAMTEGEATLVIKDSSNRVVDILYYGNSSVMYTPSTCNFVYDTNISLTQSQNKDVFRLPDGTGDWADNGSGANSGETRCTNPGGGYQGVYTIFDAFDYKSSVSNSDIGRPITTKVANKTIQLTAISTNEGHTYLLDGNITVAAWLAYKSGNLYYLSTPLQELDFKNKNVINMNTFLVSNASKDNVIAFKYCQDGTTYKDYTVCWPTGITSQQKLAISYDNFAIRPDRFVETSTHIDMPNLLRSGQDYNTTLHAYTYNTTTDTPDYNVTNANSTFTIVTTKYNRNDVNVTSSMAGTASLGTNSFDMTNGISSQSGITGEKAGVAFDDVGKINISIQDRVWAAVDINNPYDTTPRDCSSTGAYVCGDTNITFIPDHFDFNELNITNNNGNPGSFTYIANEAGQMGGRIHTQMRALNKVGNITQNFALFPLWENNVTVVPMVTKSTYLYPDANETNIMNLAIGFGTGTDANGTKRIVWNESNASQYLRFNFRRDVNQTVDPFDVNGSDLNISMTSHYIDGSNDANITGSRLSTVAPAFGSSKFVYGRIIPRDIRIFGAGIPFTANGWYEVYNTPVINTLSLPSSRNDAVWYVNVPHSDAVNGDGDANVTVVITGVNPTNTTAIGGVETYSFTGGLALGGYKAHILTAPWLWYGVNASPYLDPNGPAQAGIDNLDCLTHPCFNINVVPPAGATGSAKSTNEGTKGSKKTNTGGGAWHSTSDYAPAIR